MSIWRTTALGAVLAGMAGLGGAGEPGTAGAPRTTSAPTGTADDAPERAERPSPIVLVDFQDGAGARVQVRPGKTYVIEVASGHVNRVVTPFASPEVWTASTAEIQKRDGVLYVHPRGEAPVTLFLTEAGDESFAINLTLVPREIPPLEVTLDLEPQMAAARMAVEAQRAALAVESVQPARVEQAFAWETSQPYLATVKEVLGLLVAGDVPPGYAALAPVAAGAPCGATPGFRTEFGAGQRYRGGAFEVWIGVVTAQGGGPGAFSEAWCGGDDVAAVALWPTASLAPGQRAEIFVLRHAAVPERRPARPSLIPVGG